MNILEKITTNEIAVFTDIHYGLKSDSAVRLKIADDFVYNVFIPHIIENGIKYVFFAGDMFHSRNSINVDTMNHVIDAIEAITKHAKLYMIIGNHDLYLSESTDISSVRSIDNINNVEVISEPTVIEVNGKTVLLTPWLSDLSGYTQESVDMMVGHFDISTKYLIASYIEDQKVKSFDSSDKLIDSLLKSNAVSAKDLRDTTKEDIEAFTNRKRKVSPSKYIGNFIEICKKGGQIFSGHIHPHKKFTTKGRNFTFISSPFENDWGDIGKQFGFYNLDFHNDEYTFIESVNAPKHIEIRMSDVGDDYEFNVKGNFVKLYVDSDVEYSELNGLISKINSMEPLEPCIVNYQHKVSFNDVECVDINQMDSTEFNKSNYLVEYINTIDDETLEEKKIDRNELKMKALNYYKLAEAKVK